VKVVPAQLRAEIDAAIARAPAEEAPLVPGLVYGRQLAQRRDHRRAAGSYYSPAHLVDFVVDRTLGPLLDAAPPLSLRVLDPACGAGVFLVAALRALARRWGEHRAPEIARRCLFGVDRDPVAVEMTRMAVVLAGGAEPQLAAGDALVGEFPFPGGFDAVVGNPPWGQKGFSWSTADRSYVRRHYQVGRGVLDPYALFVERAGQLSGRWGFVLPDIILLKNQQAVRDLVLAQCAIEWIADSQRAFPGVNLDTVVLVCRVCADGVPDGHRIRVWHQLPASWRSEPPRTVEIRQGLFSELPGHKFNIRLTEPARRLWRKLDTFARLGDRFEIHEGVHTGNARAKLFVDQAVDEHCVPVVVGGSELRHGQLKWAGRWLNLAPDALDRSAGDYANLGRSQWFLRPKILVRRTGDQVVAAFDERGLYCSNNLFVVLARAPMAAVEQQAYVALLNSALMTWYYRTVQPRAGRIFPELKIEQLRQFPVPGDIAPLVAAAPADTDDLVHHLFALTPGEIRLIRGAAGPRPAADKR
jgi:adenine-specific DNA-methyltransferase